MPRPRKVFSSGGVTLLEILLAMLILGLVTAGIFTAFVFSRQVSYRSEGELIAQGWTQRISDELRTVVGLTTPRADGLTLAPPGIYVDPDSPAQVPMYLGLNPVAGCTPPTPIPLQQGSNLQFPANRYQLRWAYIVEDHLTDVDCDGTRRGRDFNGDGTTDLHWTRIVVDWAPPNP